MKTENYKRPGESLRTEIVNIRLTKQQKTMLEYNALQLGLSISQLIRQYLPL